MRFIQLKYFWLLIFVVLAGCSSTVTPSSNPLTAQPYFAPNPAAPPDTARKAGDLNLQLSEAARTKLVENLKFNEKTLLDTVRRALEASNLITAEPDQELPKIDITVTDVNVRSNFSAVMFGFLAGSDKIVGDVVVTAPGGDELQRFNIDVSYALGGLAGGQSSVRMDWL